MVSQIAEELFLKVHSMVLGFGRCSEGLPLSGSSESPQEIRDFCAAEWRGLDMSVVPPPPQARAALLYV